MASAWVALHPATYHRKISSHFLILFPVACFWTAEFCTELLLCSPSSAQTVQGSRTFKLCVDSAWLVCAAQVLLWLSCEDFGARHRLRPREADLFMMGGINIGGRIACLQQLEGLARWRLTGLR